MSNKTDISKKLRKAFKEAQTAIDEQDSETLENCYLTEVVTVLEQYSDKVPKLGLEMRTSAETPVAVPNVPIGQVNGSQRVVQEILAQPIVHHKFEVTTRGDVTQKARMRCLPLLPEIYCLPCNNTYVPLAKNMSISDEKALTFVPYLGETNVGHDCGKILEGFDITHRVRRIVEGLPHVTEKKKALIDLTLRKYGFNNKTPASETSAIRTLLANLTTTPVAFVGESIEKLKSGYGVDTTQSSPRTSRADASDLENLNSDEAYVHCLSTYRDLYCCICYTYDCSVHGNLPKPNLSAQFRLAMRKNDWSKTPALPREQYCSFCPVTELTALQKTLCLRLFHIHSGDIDKISDCLRVPKLVVLDFLVKENDNDQVNIDPRCNQEKNHAYFSLKNYRGLATVSEVLRRKQNLPLFKPCIHDGECVKGVCSCVDNHHFCIHACCNGEDSINFFRGCSCQGGCATDRCNCRGLGRECDPTLCKCGTCSDPANQPTLRQLKVKGVSGQLCQNDNILMNRRVPLLVAQSDISGWGCFTKFALKRGDFVCEYVGEVVSRDEADRRGSIADQQQLNYIFQLACDEEIDGKRKGNEFRFINHSKSPNCRPEILFVNGFQRVGLWAICDIPAQSELTFDYGELFDVTEKNDDGDDDEVDTTTNSKRPKKKQR